jgi:hypothetical protein
MKTRAGTNTSLNAHTTLGGALSELPLTKSSEVVGSAVKYMTILLCFAMLDA